MIDDSFGYWLAGFVDGEGSFQIKKNNERFVCRFFINLRADDKAVLEEIQQNLGTGYIEPQRICKNKGYNDSKPTHRFAIENKEGCLLLCKIFTEHSLKSKKSNDFGVWKKAVHHWVAHVPNDTWDYMGELYEELKQIRRYMG